MKSINCSSFDKDFDSGFNGESNGDEEKNTLLNVVNIFPAPRTCVKIHAK